MKVTVEFDIPAQTIADTMCTAIESGDPVTTAKRGGWCSGIYYKTKDTEPPPGNWYYDNPTFYEADDFQIQIVEYHEDDDTETPHTIDAKKLRDGIAKMATIFPKHFNDMVAENGDAATADLFLQAIVFGEEKYA